ncbi:MAG: adenylate/guanylate cyclase domain-containing protein [Proteobacteria bacterium]|nr:adenylate/guanylate cyclase domain-containing protein [Burkholderiales bacterium]
MSENPLFFHEPPERAGSPAATPVPDAEAPWIARAERRVLAVMFADVSNSTALYAHLGDPLAKAAIDACFERILLVLPKFDGRLVKTIGDEVLCVFPTVDQAVLAASEMQVAMSEREFGGQTIQLHIGLHYGPALVSVNDVFGDTVNVAGYLTAVAGAEQILASEAAAAQLGLTLKRCVRPVFRALLKGSQRETTVYQVVWSRDDGELTSANIDHRLPPDMGALVLDLGAQTFEVNVERPILRIGRSPKCDLVAKHDKVSRQHLLIQLRRTSFYLIDQSINGTWITRESGDEYHLLRSEVILSGAGVISLGCPQDAAPERRIVFRQDRRSAFRLSDGKADVLPFPGARRRPDLE